MGGRVYPVLIQCDCDRSSQPLHYLMGYISPYPLPLYPLIFFLAPSLLLLPPSVNIESAFEDSLFCSIW